MSRDIDERAHPLVASIARHVHRKFRQWTTFEDVKQDAYLWCVQKPRKVTEYLDGGKEGEKKMMVSLRRYCEQQARKEKAAAMGGSTTDEFFYEISQLADLLPFVFDHETWGEQPESLNTEKVSGSRQPSEGGNWVTTMVDLSAAYDRLVVDDRRLLRRYYRDGWTFDRIGKSEGTGLEAARQDVGRALMRLLDELGGATPWE